MKIGLIITSVGLLFCFVTALLIVVAINAHYYYFKFRPFMMQKYNYLFNWMNGVDLGFYKQHGGASNPIRALRLFLFPSEELFECNDYVELRNEPGFNKMRRLAVVILTLTILMVIDVASLLIVISFE